MKTALRQLLQNHYLILIARALLGLLFVAASIDKIADPVSFAKAIEHYKLLSPDFCLIAATILPWIELLCGLSILFGVFERGAALILTVLLVLFTVAIIVALLRHLDIACGCFTRDPSAQKLGWEKLIENTGWIILSVFLLFSEKTTYSIEGILEHFKKSR